MDTVKFYFENVFFLSHREVQWKEQWARSAWIFDFVLFLEPITLTHPSWSKLKPQLPKESFTAPQTSSLPPSLCSHGDLKTIPLSTCISVCLPNPAKFLDKEEDSCFAAQHLEGSCHRKVHLLQLLCELILFFHHSQCTNSQKLCIFSLLHFLPL